MCIHCGGMAPIVNDRCSSCGHAIDAGDGLTIGGASPVAGLMSSREMDPDAGVTIGLAGIDAALGTAASIGVLPDRRTIAFGGVTLAPGGAPPIGDFSDSLTVGPGTGGQPTDSGPSGPLRVGEGFGNRYHIIRVLGIGGMGAVYHAWDAELGMALALKVVRPEATTDPVAARDMERRFKQELVLARKVTHKNVVRIHDLGEINGTKYITMPYLEGSDLATILKKSGKLPVADALRVVRDVASGLVAAHEAGIVHRDLKPANIMIEDDRAIIMDFGIARSAASTSPPLGPGAMTDKLWSRHGKAAMTVVGTVLGTVEYMAPEQAKGQAIDQRADIYALGLIFSDMLLGKRPSSGADETPISQLRKRIAEAPPPVRSVDPAIPPAVERLISRCLEPDPGARFQTSAELVAELDRLDENGILIPEPRRFTPRMMAAAVFAVATLVSGTWWLTRTPPAAKKHDPVTVLIADFENGTSDPAFDHTLEPMLKLALEDAGFISAYDRTKIRSTFAVQPPDKLDAVAARRLAVKQGVGVVLAGTIGRRGSGFEISVNAIQTVTGKPITSLKGRAPTKDQVLETATKLMASVRQKLGDETSESSQLFAMRSVSASSLEVVTHYAAAVEAQAKGKLEDARQSYLKAVELDPKFGLGYQGLAVMSRNLGQLDDANKYIKAALRYVEGMTERERFATRGFYYRMIGDNQQCAKEYGESLARYPADTVARNQRAACLVKLRNMQEARGEMRQAVQLLPNHAGYRTNLALLADLAGDFPAAEAEVQNLQSPDHRALLALAYSQLGRGMLDEATETYQKMASMGAQGASSAASGLGDLAVYKGRFADAVRIFEEGAAADLAAKNPDKAAIKFTSAAYAYLKAGEKGRAVADADKAEMASKAMPVRFLAARIFVEAGQIDKARKLAEGLSSELPAEPQAHGKIIEGLIALKGENPREAIKILMEANNLLDTWIGHFDLGRAYFEATAYTQADSEFERCLTRRGEALSLMDEGPTYGHFPFVYYYQGRVRQEMNTASFADSYREYLKIRAESKDDPLLPDVRKRAG